MMNFWGNRLHCIVFVMIQLSFLTTTKAIHETVKVKIKNGDEIIELNWKRTGTYLANRNLPVWEAVRDAEPHLTSNMFEKTGEFIAYHDVEKSSAVVYLTKLNCFYGIIDTRFYVSRLPLPSQSESDTLYDVGGTYIIGRGDTTRNKYFHDSPNIWLSNLFTDDQLQSINSAIDSMDSKMSPDSSTHLECNNQAGSSTPCSSAQDIKASSSSEKILYPEILVFVPNDIFELFRKASGAEGLAMLITYYVLYFNAIDMMFAKLATEEGKIRMNIAGIVLETENGALPDHTLRCLSEAYEGTSYCHHGDNMLTDYTEYINEYGTIFVEDSFDFFFISTNRPILSNGLIVNAQSTPLISIYSQRTTYHSDQEFLGLIATREVALGDYVAATREIAKLMHIKTDRPGTESLNCDRECFAIMQNSETHCRNCLKWSDESRHDFHGYVRFNSNHCFLLNYPRSLCLHGAPIPSIPPEDQCLCYNFPRDNLNPFYMMSIPPNSCNEPMQCMYDQDPRILTPLPLDGTPCSFSNKVCWQKQCLDIGQYSSSHK